MILPEKNSLVKLEHLKDADGLNLIFASRDTIPVPPVDVVDVDREDPNEAESQIHR